MANIPVLTRIKQGGQWSKTSPLTTFLKRGDVATANLPPAKSIMGKVFIGGFAPITIGGSEVISTGAGNLIKKAFTSTKLGLSRAFVNPFAGTTIKTGLQTVGKNILGKGLAYGLGYEAFQFGRAGATGEKPKLIPDLYKVLGIALNPIAGFTGIAFGEAQNVYQGAKQSSFNPFQNLSDPSKMSFPSIPDIKIPSVNQVFNLPNTNPLPSDFVSPSASYTAPSVSLSGGGGSIPPELLLAMLGLGVGGYLLGRRKRKKKKSKKRRHVKK